MHCILLNTKSIAIEKLKSTIPNSNAIRYVLKYYHSITFRINKDLETLFTVNTNNSINSVVNCLHIFSIIQPIYFI